MLNQIFTSPRRFQIWKYVVGHKVMLLRSVKSEDFNTRVDILFKGVKAIHLPTAFDGLDIAEMDTEEMPTYIVRIDGRSKLFHIRGATFEGYVIAQAIVTHEDQGEYNEPSFFAVDNLI